MAEIEAKTKSRKVVRRPGFRRVMVTITEEQAKRLDELALADDRRGKATEMLTILVKRNFDSLVDTLQPARPTLFASQREYINLKGTKLGEVEAEAVSR